MKEHFKYSSDKQLFRILISDSDKLLLETRNVKTKEVFFHCFDLENGEKFFSDLQLEEKRWLGVEAIYKDIIFFHRFPKPDLPGHREIIAFDIPSQKIIWTNSELTFQFIYQDKVYCFVQGFEERKYFTLNFQTGKQLEELGNNYSLINQLRRDADALQNWDKYVYPEKLSTNENELVTKLIALETEKKNLEGEIEYSAYKDFLFFNYHEKEKNQSFTNKFCAINLKTSEPIFSKELNKNTNNLFTDSFFVYKDYIFLLVGKNEVNIYKLV